MHTPPPFLLRSRRSKHSAYYFICTCKVIEEIEILQECSCFIEFIKQVVERDKMRGFRNTFNEFNNTGA